jgi:multidrug efflux pump
MTSLATILGVLPIALSLGAASLSRQSLGIAVVGGLLGATFLSLYLVPALYSFLSPRRRAARGVVEVATPIGSSSPISDHPAPAK